MSEKSKNTTTLNDLKLQDVQRYASIGQVTADLLHEISNPLAILQLSLDDLSDYMTDRRLQDPYLKSKIQKQYENLERISKIIRNMRDYIKQDPYKIYHLDINDVILNCLNALNPIFFKEKIEVIKELEPETIKIAANSAKIHQVFFNIITNARNSFFDDQSSKIISIITEKQLNKIVITISDNGKGIKDDELQSISTSFYIDKKNKDHLGIGLAVSHKIIQDLNGSIEVDSGPDRGTTVVITFPLKNITSTNITNYEKKDYFSGINRKILVVDDEIDMLKILKRYLAKLGFEVDTAKDGNQGLDYLRKNQYQYLISDLKMPNMTGEELIRYGKELNLLDDTIVLIITGGIWEGLDDNQVNSLRTMIDGQIQKPFTKDEILNILRKFYY